MAKRTTFVLDRDSSDLSSLSEDSSSESSEQTRKRAKTKQISAKKNIGKVSNGPKKSAVSDVKELDSQRDALVNNKQLEKDGVLLPAGYSVALNALISFCDLNQRLLEVGNTDNLFSLLATTRFGKLELQKLTWRIRRQPLEEFQEQVSDLINFAAANLLAQRKENKATIALKNHLAELAAVLPTLLQSEALRKFDGASSDTGALAQATEKREAKEGKREKNPRGVAEKLVAKRSINVTGVRTGETIVGNQGLCAGTVIENVGCNVPPVLEDVLLVKSFDDLWEKLIASLVDLEFFREMSSEDRGNWIVDHAEPETLLHMMDMDGVAFKVIVLGKNDNISKLSGDELDELMAREEISARELADMFPRNTGSTTLGGHHTLFTGRNYWKIMPRDPSTESVSKDTLVINVARFDEPAVRFGPVSCGPSEELVRIIVAEFEDESEQGSTPYACLFNERGVQMHFQTLCSHYGISQDIADQFTLATSQLTCAALKSLLQKLVRFRPGSVLLPRDLGQMAAVDTLKCCFLALLCSSGSFVPDIQRFVSGVESALKRLAVIAFEDSYPSNPRLLAELLACAFISQRYKTWRPNLEQITRWLDYLVGLHAADSAIVYDLARGSSKKRTSLVKAAAEISKSDSTGHYMAASALIDVVRSFAGDLSMIRDICTTPPTKWAITKVSEQTGTNSVVMPLHHCVDQHWAPEVAYFFGPITWLYEECARGAKSIKASTPFAGILSRLFNEVTGTNPRRTKCAFNHYEFEKNDFVKRARDAQHACLLSIQLKAGDLLKRPKVVEEKREHKPSSVDMNEASVEVNVELPDAWLSGLLGTIEVQKGKMLAALVPDNISSAMVAKRPAVRKNNKKGDDDSSGSTRPTMTAKSASVAAGLSEDAETLAGEAEFWEKLSRGGFPLDAIPMAPLKDLQGSTLRYDGESFQLRLANGEEIPWDAARKANIVLPLLQSPVQSVENLSQVAEALLGLGSVDWISYVDYVRESITYDDDGITNNAGEVWSSIISPLFRRHPGAGRRLLSYLQRNSPEIEINRLGREGGGSEAAVIVHDAGAFHLLLILSWLYPGVLGRVPGRLRFVVRCPPKLWEIRTELQEMLSSLEQVSENKTSQPRDALWAGLGDSTRTMIGYQQELTDELLDAHARGRTGHFLWLPPGAGKTKIVCETLTQLVANGKLPPYVVYCLPKESMQTIVDELRIYNFRFRILAANPASAKRYADEISSQKANGVDLNDEDEDEQDSDHSDNDGHKRGEKRKRSTKTSKGSTAKKQRTDKATQSKRTQLVVDFPANTPSKVASVLAAQGGEKLPENGLRKRGWVHLVEHDHLRVLVASGLLPSSGDTFFIIDEVHLTMSESTQRTQAAQSMADACNGFVALTGTPIIDSNLYRLISWLRFLVPFTVTERNLWSAAVNMVARRVEATGIPRIYEYADATFNESEESQWKRLMPPRLGGLNKMAGARDFAKAAEISYTTATRGMLAQVRVLLKEQKRRGVMLVARNATHAQEMYDELERMNVVPVSQVLLFVGASSVPKKGVKDKKTFSDDMGTRNVVTSVNLTPVNNTKKIRVVIVPYRRATGYTLTAMDSLVWTVYPSNQALRTQLEARIDRVGQTSDSLIYIKVVTPLLRLIAERHAAAKTLEDALSAVVKDAL